MSKITKNLTGYGLTIEAKKESDENSSFIYYGDVLPEWIDMNGHMNVAYYVKAFDPLMCIGLNLGLLKIILRLKISLHFLQNLTLPTKMK